MKIILATENNKIKNCFSKLENNSFYNKKMYIYEIQYREAIIEILKKNPNINFIFFFEKLPGQIGIEKLILEIKKINKNIIIIFILEKDNKNNKKKLKELGIKKIFIIKNFNEKKLFDIINENEKKILMKNKNRFFKIYLYNIIKTIKKINNKKNIKKYSDKKNINNKIICIFGEKKSGKTTIAYLIIILLLNKYIKKNILLINISKTKKININKYKSVCNKIINIYENYYICNKKVSVINFFIHNNKSFYKDIKKIIEQKKEHFNFIIIDIDYIEDKNKLYKIFNLANKKIYVFNNNLLKLKKLKKEILNNKKMIKKKEDNLYIIYNNFKFRSISIFIIKKYLNGICDIYKNNYSNSLYMLNERIFKNKNIRIKNKIKKMLNKILL